MAALKGIVWTAPALMIVGLLASSAVAYAEPVAVRGGTLVDVRSGKLVENVTVVIDGDRIVSVTPGGTAPAGAKVIDAKGKYILPGLIDLHVHYDEWAPELYLNHGVTTVVDLGNYYEWIKAQKEGIEAGFVPGPRMFHAPPALEGAGEDEEGGGGEALKRIARSLKGTEEAHAVMREYMAQGVNSVKVYDKLTVEQVKAIVAEAKKGDIPVIGHFKNVRIAAEAGAEGIEHIGAVANAIIDEPLKAEASKKLRKGLRMPSESYMDVKRIPEIVKFMVDKGLYLNPTMRMSWQGDRALREKRFHYEDFDLTFNDWRLRYVPLAFRMANLKEYQEIGVWHWADLSQYEQDLFHQGYLNAQKVIKAFHEAGGKMYAGTDSAHMAVPGLSLHQEMELIVDAGAPALAALQASTINPAALMRMSNKLGTVEAGKTGDLVILDANPLADIRNTRKISQVISRGNVLDMQYHADFKNPIPRNYPEDSSHYFPSPEIQSGNPIAVEAESTGTVLTLKGTGFIPYSIARFNGTKLNTEFVDTRTLRVALPPALLQPGTYPITVENPDFGWGSVSVGVHLSHLGIREPISNEFMLLVGVKKGATTTRKATP